MDLSIIIVSYNTKELLKRCLESVISDQWLVTSERSKKNPTNHQPPIISHQSLATEIIVVDNGSADGSQEVVRSVKSKVGKFKLRIVFIENKENLGFAKAVNKGINESQGKVVLLLNSDVIIKPGTLEELLKYEEKFRPAIIGAKMLNPDKTVQGSCFYLPTIGRAIKEYWFGRSGYFSKYAPIGDKSVEVETVSGGAMLISKGVIDKIGLFDESYFMYFEDLDYCRKAGKAGFRVYYLPSAEVIHEHGASGRTLTDDQNQWRRLIPSSKIYHGLVKHYLLNFILWTGQKLRKKSK